MVLAINGLQERVSGADKRVINMEHKISGIDQDVVAIMRHLDV